jgi:hypothetical protein
VQDSYSPYQEVSFEAYTPTKERKMVPTTESGTLVSETEQLERVQRENEKRMEENLVRELSRHGLNRILVEMLTDPLGLTERLRK